MPKKTNKIEQKASRLMRELNMTARGDLVLCALSGGPDSVALFHLLRALQPVFGYSLGALHLNHGLRGAESDRDEAFVRALCSSCGVPLTAGRIDMANGSRPAGESLETAARGFRYAFFEREAAAAETRTGKRVRVATAHTADDNAETLLFRLVRGTSLPGAGAIPPVRGRYIRPLLGCTRREILGYDAANGFGYVTDSTNLVADCSRNRIRLQVLPALEQINQEATAELAAFAEDARGTAAYLQSLADELLGRAACRGGWRAALLAAAPDPLLRAAVAERLAEKNVYGREKVAACLSVIRGETASAQLTGQVTARRSGGVFYLEDPQAAFVPAGWSAPFAEGTVVLPDGGALSVSVISDYEKIVKFCRSEKKQLKYYADYDMITCTSVFRMRRPGDVFEPAGRHVTKSLGKLLGEDGVPRAKRGALPLLADGGRVLWLAGYGFCGRLVLRENSRRAVVIRMEDIRPDEPGGASAAAGGKGDLQV